jgi:hypothetical protein
MLTRYKVLQAVVAFLVALGPLALGGDWAWAQQDEINPAARQSGQCQGAEEIGTVGPREGNRDVSFRAEGDKIQLTYKTTKLDNDGEPFLDVTVLKGNKEVGGRVIRDQGTEREIVTEAPGRFTMEIRAEDLTYEIIVEDCTGEDQSAANDQYRDEPDIDDALDTVDNIEDNLGFGNDLGPGDDLGSGDDPGSGTGDGEDASIPEDVITETIPDRPLPDTGGTPLFGLAVIGLACVGLGVAVLRSAIRRA